MVEIFKKLFQQIFGFFLILLGLIGFFAILSYNPYDPAWNVTSNAVVKNWGGVIGANISSLYLAFIGFTGYYVSFVFCIWGFKIVKGALFKNSDEQVIWFKKPSAKFIFFTFSVVSVSAFCAFFDVFYEIPKDWVTNSYGGHLGYMILNNLYPLIGSVFYAFAFFSLSFVLAFATLGISINSWSKFIVFISGSIYGLLKLLYEKIKIVFSKFFNLIARKYERKSIIKEHKESRVERKIVPLEKKEKKPRKVSTQESFDIEMRDAFQLPPLSILDLPADHRSKTPSESSLSSNAELLEKVLGDFGVQGKITEVQPGPVVTRYILEPAPGTKSSRVIGLADDIARSMTATSARISVVEGQNAIGIELPNSYRETVYLKELLSSDEYKKIKAALPISLGKDISGSPVIIDLAKTPHLLVAGTTGSGKSVGLNAMILSLLYKYSPNECKFIMIDPKMLELSVYQDIPHLLTPVVTEPQKAIVALKWIVKEMENRYRLMSNLNVRNIDGYNDKILDAKKKGQVLTRTVQTGYDPDTGQPKMEEVPLNMEKLPYIVVVVDEMADLMLVAGKEIEASIQRLAQMARAAGIHVILATQRPSVDVITGIIKANFPSRISYQVTSKIDSRTILGEMGAEQLLGMGDLLYMASGSKISRIHGPFVKDGEVEEIAKYLRSQGKPEYISDVTAGDGEEMFAPSGAGAVGAMGAGSEGGEKDSLFDQAVAIVLRDNKVSTSYVQRALKIGYNRAANIIDQMEEDGIISEPDHVGRRKILIK